MYRTPQRPPCAHGWVGGTLGHGREDQACTVSSSHIHGGAARACADGKNSSKRRSRGARGRSDACGHASKRSPRLVALGEDGHVMALADQSLGELEDVRLDTAHARMEHVADLRGNKEGAGAPNRQRSEPF